MNNITIQLITTKFIMVVVDDDELMDFLDVLQSSSKVKYFIVNEVGSGPDIDPDSLLTKLK